MRQFDHAGRVFATLRSLRGLSLSEAAHAASLPVTVVEAAERGELTDRVKSALAPLYGLRAEDFLAEGAVMPDPASRFTVFLLHGEYQDFDAADLLPLERSLRAARVFGAFSSIASESITRRMRFTPVQPAGPLPRDAARQGHALARRVRKELGLEGDPLGDLRVVLEELFGIVVLVAELATTDLRAASVLDADRAAAAVLLAHDDESRARNPMLARVYLAHELCHVLFDPAAPGCVQIALDERPQGRSRAQGAGRFSLLESRAKGFAAEFLLPRQGLAALLGPWTAPETGFTAAREMVRRSSTHFRTPWEIAVYHLKNLEIIDENLVYDLLEERPLTRVMDSTALPGSGAPPLALRDLPDAIQVWHGVDVRAAEVPLFVKKAIGAAQTATRALAEETLAHAYDEVASKRPIAATDLLIERLDAWLQGNELGLVRAALDQLDPDRLPPAVLTGVLSLSLHAKTLLGATREHLFNRVMTSLDLTWRLPAERREKIAARLQ